MRKFRMSIAIQDEFEFACRCLHLSQPAFIEIAVMRLLADKDSFVVCPSCYSYLAFKSLVDTARPVKRYYCGCNTSVWYDTKVEYIIKFKIRLGAEF